MTRLVQDYFLEPLNEKDYFGLKTTYPPTPSRLFLQIFLRALKENRLKPDYILN